jgi:replicative DNA helicase
MDGSAPPLPDEHGYGLGRPVPIRPDVVMREQPQAVMVEMALLGAMLVNNRAYEQVSDFLRPEHFYDTANGRIYAWIAAAVERGEIATPGTLARACDEDPAFSDVGGSRYVAELASEALNIVDAAYFGRTIHDMAMRRALIEIGEETVNRAYAADMETTAADLVEHAEARLFDVAGGQAEEGFAPVADAFTAAIAKAEAAYQRQGIVRGVSTGLRAVDKVIGALAPSDLVILAGRPGMGKSALATNIAEHAARKASDDGPCVVGFFSLEMSEDQLATRILAARAGISTHRIERGEINNAEFQALLQAKADSDAMRLHIDATAGQTVQGLRTRARRLLRKHGRLDLVVIDYLQLIETPGRQRPDNRVQEVSAITRSLKKMAKELDVPVLALSQLSRAVESRDNKRPQLADLRESGSIEQDADLVLFVYREDYYHNLKKPDRDDPDWPNWSARSEQIAGRAEIIVAKNRHGPTGTAEARFEGATQFFRDNPPTTARMPFGDE